MKVRMLVGQAGADFTRDPGLVYDVEKDEAKRLVESGQAEPVKEEKTEQATAKTSKAKSSK